MKTVNKLFTFTATACLSLIFALQAAADVDVLIIGSTKDSSEYIYGGSATAFNPTQVRNELYNILNGAGLGNVNVVLEERYTQETSPSNWTVSCYNLSQWFHFGLPADVETTTRWPNLRGEKGTQWDYVILIGDSYTMEATPGLYTHGVSLISKEVAKGTAETVLLMPWPGPGS